eukprot:3614728-Prorocentrum_lima.AAC.1
MDTTSSVNSVPTAFRSIASYLDENAQLRSSHELLDGPLHAPFTRDVLLWREISVERGVSKAATSVLRSRTVVWPGTPPISSADA